jgi:hypothetical protein
MDPEEKFDGFQTKGIWADEFASITMNMPDGGTMTPDLKWFDERYNPGSDPNLAAHLKELASIYGEEHILTVEEKIAQLNAKQAAFRKAKAAIVKNLRRTWRERNAIYDESSGFGSF